MGYLSLLAVTGFGLFALALAASTGNGQHKFEVDTALAAHRKLSSRLPLKVDSYIDFMKGEGITSPDEELTAIFNLMDKNRNGHLEQAEFVTGHLLYLEFGSYDVDKNYYLNATELMDTMDVDRSGKLSFIELFARVNTGYKLDADWKLNLGTDYYKNTN